MTNNTNDNVQNQTAQAQSNKEQTIRPLLSLEDDMSEEHIVSTFIADTEPWQGGRVSSFVTCVKADNPSPMTYVGTNTWLIANPDKVQGEDTRCIVVDPSPEGEQTQRILDACEEMGVKVGAIFLTHDHHDHTAGAVELAQRAELPSMDLN